MTKPKEIIFRQDTAEHKKMKKYCKWFYDEHHDKWDTDCGNAFGLITGTPKDNLMKYCPYCGKLIKQIETPKSEK